MKFKTNAKCGACEAAIANKLNMIISGSDWSLDLDSADKVLTVTADIPEATIISAVEDAGFRIKPLD